MIFFLSLIVSVILTALAHVLLKMHTNRVSSMSLSRVDVYLSLSLLFFVLAPLFYTFSLKEINLNIAFSFTSLIYILVLFFSRLFLKEEIPNSSVIGTVIISSGLLIYNI